MGVLGQSFGLHDSVEPLTSSGASGPAAFEALGALGGSFAGDSHQSRTDPSSSGAQDADSSEQAHDQVDGLGSLWLSD